MNILINTQLGINRSKSGTDRALMDDRWYLLPIQVHSQCGFIVLVSVGLIILDFKPYLTVRVCTCVLISVCC